MRPILMASFGLLFWAAAAFAQEAEALRRAMEARLSGDWEAAARTARGAGPLGRDIIEWHRLRAGQGSFDATQAFLARRADWPGLPLLRTQSERNIPERADAAEVIAYFADQAPRTGTGALRYAAALERTGRGEAATAELQRAWRTLSLSEAEEAAFRARHARILRGQHRARVDALLWRGRGAEAARMLALLEPGDRALAEARIALRAGRAGVDTLIEAVPAALRDDPGLAYERFLWRVNRGRTEDAIALMEAQETLGRPEAWGNLRRRYARQLMRDNQDRRAYSLAARHGLTEGRHYADLEWLSGYIALRKLRDADTALAHFERFERAVDTPISLARAQYWQARAHAAVGNAGWAAEDYGRAAQHQTAFYGLLAAEAAGLPMDPALTGQEAFAPWRETALMESSVFQAAVLLLAAGEFDLGERFLTHYAETLSRTEIGQLATFAREIGEPHLEVMIAKRAVQYGHVIEGPYFALHPLGGATGDIAPELALAIARRESEFDPKVISPVGARGLMQLMPATAQEMAGDLGLPYQQARLLSDPDYNTRLGLTYLAELQTTFGESPVLIAVAYNAGPSRAVSWSARFGDPRDPRVDIVDWIEHIPFRETRNYVMRVTESLPIYRARLAGAPGPIGLMEDLRGARPSGQVFTGFTESNGAAPPAAALTQSLRPRLRPDVPATE